MTTNLNQTIAYSATDSLGTTPQIFAGMSTQEILDSLNLYIETNPDSVFDHDLETIANALYEINN